MSAHPNKQDLENLIAKLRQAETTLPAEITPLLNRLTSLVATLPADGTLDALKKPGAWFDVPLPATTADAPYYVKTPIQVEVVNVSSPELTVQLHNNPAQPIAAGSLVTIADTTASAAS